MFPSFFTPLKRFEKSIKTNLLFIFFLSFIFFSCSKTITSENTTIIQEDTWGIDFQSKVISDSSSFIQEKVSKAIVYILDNNGGGTGFFISEDGLLLTNAHVIDDDGTGFRCTQEECSQYRFFIRDFTPKGDKEKFTKFKVIALNRALDFALIKIDLPSGKKVPFLNIDTTEKKIDDLENRELGIIGHLGGSQTRVSPARISAFQKSNYQLYSPALSGQSGSPLIDLQTGDVLGLYHSGQWDKGSIRNDDKSVKHFGYASKINLVVDTIKKGLRNLEGSPDKKIELKDFLPPTSKKVSEDEATNIKALITQELQSPTSDEQALKWINNLKLYPYVKNLKISDMLNQIINFELRYGKSFFKKQTNAKEFLKIATEIKEEDESEENFDSFKIKYNLKTNQECVQNVSNDTELSNLEKFYLLTRRCLSTHDAENSDLIEKINVLLLSGDIKMNNYQDRSTIWETLTHQLLLRENLSAKHLSITNDILMDAYSKEIYILDKMDIENKILLLNHMPKLLLKGGFAETIH
jgi:hypothetical protein